MERTIVARHLAMAEKHIAGGERDLARHEELLTPGRKGQDTSDAEARLVQFEEVQAIFIAQRDRLRQELNRSVRESP